MHRGKLNYVNADSETRPLTIVCLATYFKAAILFASAKRLGCNVILVTKEKCSRRLAAQKSDRLIARCQRCWSAVDDRPYRFHQPKVKVDRWWRLKSLT